MAILIAIYAKNNGEDLLLCDWTKPERTRLRFTLCEFGAKREILTEYMYLLLLWFLILHFFQHLWMLSIQLSLFFLTKRDFSFHFNIVPFVQNVLVFFFVWGNRCISLLGNFASF